MKTIKSLVLRTVADNCHLRYRFSDHCNFRQLRTLACFMLPVVDLLEITQGLLIFGDRDTEQPTSVQVDAWHNPR